MRSIQISVNKLVFFVCEFFNNFFVPYTKRNSGERSEEQVDIPLDIQRGDVEREKETSYIYFSNKKKSGHTKKFFEEE